MAATKLSLKILACEIAQREISHLVAQSPHLFDLEFLPVGHHDEPRQGHGDLQARVDAIPTQTYDAILIGYGVCSLMLEGLSARHTQLVIPRAHDCITWFLGGKERYARLFESDPGTYYFTAGWLEFPQRKSLRQGGLPALRQAAGEVGQQMTAFGLGKTWAELVAKYGEENARYLLDVTQRWADHYNHGTLISFECTAGLGLRCQVEGICQQRGWNFQELAGDLGLLRRWLGGQWDEKEFLIAPPNHTVHSSYNEQVIEARPAAEVPGPTPIDPGKEVETTDGHRCTQIRKAE